MEFVPRTEVGKNLIVLLEQWMKNSPKNQTEVLHHILLYHSCQIMQKDKFISSLYGQNVLQERPLEWYKFIKNSLVEGQHLSPELFRVQHAVGMSLEKKCTRELVVALEWSNNDDVLTEIYNPTRVPKSIWMLLLRSSQ